MANTNQPKGFELIGYKNGQVNGSVNAYFIPSTYAVQLVVGDPVIKTGTANTLDVNQGSLYRKGTLPEINRAALTGAVVGIIIGFEFIPDNGDKAEFNPANTERVALVSDDPNALYRAQFNTTTNITETGVGQNFNHILEETPDLVNGNSGVEIDGSTGGVGATLQFKFERFEGTGTNEVGAIHDKGVFSINNHQNVPNTAGI